MLTHLPPEPLSPSDPPPNGGLKWTQLRAIMKSVFPTTSKFGKPTTFLTTSQHIVIGTSGAEILVYNYSQQLVAQFNFVKSVGNTQLGFVSSLNCNPNEDLLVVGFGLGSVLVCDFSGQLVCFVPPLNEHEVPIRKSKIKQRETHKNGSLILHVFFPNSTSIISVDVNGIVCIHVIKRYLKTIVFSTKLLGSYLKSKEVLSASSNGVLLSLITREVLLVIDFEGKIKLQVLKSQDFVGEVNNSVVYLGLRYLVYSWNNVVKLIEFNFKFEFNVLGVYKHHETVLHLGLVNELVVLVGMLNVALCDVRNQQLIDNDMDTLSPAKNCLWLETRNLNLFVLGKYELVVGQFTNFADRLLGLLNANKMVRAIKLLVDYLYDDGNLELLGLPADTQQKNEVILEALPSLVVTSLKYGIEYDNESLEEVVSESVKACVMSKLSLEFVLELVETNSNALEYFCDSVVKCVQSGLVSMLPAPVFRLLVSKRLDPILFYKLDLKTLDLDLAFKMCKLYPAALGDAEVYLENMALNDFVTPIKTSERCFEYLSFVLTGREFPTNTDMDEHVSLEAKRQIYSALFTFDSDLLRYLYKKNEKKLLDCLNLALQDSYFNLENVEVNRQIVINVLLKFELNVKMASFLARQFVKFQQFVVLRHSVQNDIVDTLLRYRPPKNTDTSEEQLSLISLLSVYKVADNQEFILRCTQAGYLLVLEHIFRRQGKLLKLAQVQLDFSNTNTLKTLVECFLKEDVVLTQRFVNNNFPALLELDAEGLGVVVARFGLMDMWPLGSKNLAFMNSAYLEVHRRGGQLPNQQINTDFLALVIQNNENFDFLLGNILKGKDDIALPMIVDLLVDKNRFDVLAELLKRQGRYSEALIYIVNYLPEIKTDEEVKKYVMLCIDLCQQSGKDKVKMFLRLLETLLLLKSDQLPLVVQAIADTDVSEVVEVVSYLLNIATPGQPQKSEVIGQLHTNILSRERALRSFLSIIQLENYEFLLKLMERRARGWVVPVNGECEVCGQKIAGLGVDAVKLYAAWEGKLTNKNGGNALLLFRCGHSYHLECLEKIWGRRECVVCESKDTQTRTK